MAKKKSKRRVPSAATPRMYGNGKPSQPSSARPTQPASAPAIRAGSRPAAPSQPAAHNPAVLAQEYRYVLSDLRRLGILAAATFAILIILGLIIR
jgi:hypothetical protein